MTFKPKQQQQQQKKKRFDKLKSIQIRCAFFQSVSRLVEIEM